VDSTAGWFDGEGYRITFDLGRFGERLDRLAEEHQAVLRASSVVGLRATEVVFTPIDEPLGWARVLQVDLGGDRTLTIRVSCDRVEHCGFADAILASILVAHDSQVPPPTAR
jgi:hypothetical protein